uniref:Uncharacterized protein n=1 Tax=Xiphophorus maculatus TaxID=8083 RepID=A0A3B5R3K3_XIPMA
VPLDGEKNNCPLLSVEAIRGTLKTVRQCKIDVTNNSSRYVLHNPRTYTLGGAYADPLSPRIKPSSSGAAVVSKTLYTGRGFSGVFTYDLLDSSTRQPSERLAVFFKVPYDLNIRKNEYAVGLLDVARECDENLYKHMATDLTVVRGQAKGPSLTFTGKDVTIRATMSENHAPVIKVDLDDD